MRLLDLDFKACAVLDQVYCWNSRIRPIKNMFLRIELLKRVFTIAELGLIYDDTYRSALVKN